MIHLGSEKCVTESCHLLQVKGMNIMADWGLKEAERRKVKA